MDTDIHLIYGSDDNYFFPTAISAASAAYGVTRKNKLYIHLFDFGITDTHYSEFECLIKKANNNVILCRHQLSSHIFDGYGAWRGSVATYSRMFVQDILPDLEWAIYVDGDTLWLGDIGKLWDLRNSSYLIQASIDPPPPLMQANLREFEWYKENNLKIKHPEEYFCAGLILLNLKGLREFDLSSKCKNFMSKYKMPRVVDQTVLNYILQGHSSLLPPEWGVFSVWHGRADLNNDACIHYVSDLPWRRDKINRLLSDIVLLWFDFSKTALHLDLLPKTLSLWGRNWRRLIFVLIKNNQWILSIHPFIKSRLRNTHGLPKETQQLIRSRWIKS